MRPEAPQNLWRAHRGAHLTAEIEQEPSIAPFQTSPPSVQCRNMATSPHSNQVPPKPGVIGRTVRFVFGGALLYFFVTVLLQASAFLARQPGWRIPAGDWWLAGIICFYALPRVLKDSFELKWKWPVLVVVVLGAGAIIADWFEYHALWVWPLGLLIFSLTLLVLGYGGASFLVAGFIASPG